MMWFKHMSDLQRDEGIRAYLEVSDNRFAAYGFLMLVMEIIVERMEFKYGDPKCSATFSKREWARLTDCHVNRVNKYLPTLGVIGWVHVTFDGSNCTVEIPNLLEWRDEYSRKSGQAPDKVAQSRAEQTRPEQRESMDEGALSNCLTARAQNLTPPLDFEIDKGMQEWASKNHPLVDIHKETEKFRLYEFKKPCSDWVARWKLWIIGNDEHQQKHDRSSNALGRIPTLMKLGKELRVQSKQDESEAEYCNRVEEANKRRIADLNS